MSGRKMTKVKPLSAPTKVFAKNAKKPEADDMPGKMRGGMRKPGAARKRLHGVKI